MKKATNFHLARSAAIVVAGCVFISLFTARPPARAETSRKESGKAALEAAINNPARSPADRARDRYRHPLQTLQFFGIKPDMTVVEIWPGGGWYTAILAPYLREHGKLYAAVAPGPRSEAYRRRLATDPKLYGAVTITELGPPDHWAIAPPHRADMVLTFRNVHNWMRGGFADKAFEAMYEALRPGGILGVVEHRGNPKLPQDPKAASGYGREDYVIKLAEKAGFHLVA